MRSKAGLVYCRNRKKNKNKEEKLKNRYAQKKRSAQKFVKSVLLGYVLTNILTD